VKKPVKKAASKLAKKIAPKTTDDLLELDPSFAAVAQAFAKDPLVTSGKMMSSFGLEVGGKIFAMMVRGAFVAKLPKNRVEQLVSAKKGSYFDPRRDGRVMKEWISIADRRAPWLDLAREAYRFVKTGKA
jgi:TfoX/Sxy family transcriptional regulator of competence genes